MASNSPSSSATVIPKLPQYDQEKISFDLYVALIEATFTTYRITDEVMKKNLLITNIGMENFAVLANLTAPESPSDKSFDQLIAAMKKHFITKPSYHRSLVVFQQRRKKEGESLKDLYADLKKLAKDCHFGDTFDQRLRDQLFMAVDSLLYFKFLLAEDLNLEEMSSDKLLDRLQTLEKAHLGENVTHSSALNVNKIEKPQAKNGLKCKHCGYPHLSANCKFKNLSCNNCGIKGHLQAVCRKPKEGKSYSNRYKTNQPKANDKIKSVEVDKEDFLYKIGENVNVVSKPEIYNFKLNGMLVALEIDSGACVSLLSDKKATQLGVQIKPVDKSFTAYHIILGQLRNNCGTRTR